jgi:hypothetical protein
VSENVAGTTSSGAEITISPDAAAVLEFTTSRATTREAGEVLYVTSKEAFIWAGVAAYVAQSDTKVSDLNLTTRIMIAARASEDVIWENASELPALFLVNNFIRRASAEEFPSVVLVDGSKSGAPVLNLSPRAEVSAFQVMRAFIDSFIRSQRSANYQDALPMAVAAINASIRHGHQELMEADLITDPVIDPMLGFAILPFVPFSIVKRTKNGEVVYRRIQAGLWKYERARGKGGIMDVNLTFETARIARTLKKAVVAAYHEITKGAGEEQEE